MANWLLNSGYKFAPMRMLFHPSCFAFGALTAFFTLSLLARETNLPGLNPQLAWSITRSSDRFLAVAKGGRAGYAAASTNGADWTMERLIVGFNAVAHGSGKFVAVGEHGALGVTTNGARWRITSITTNELCGVGFKEGCFIATGCPPVREAFTSSDCIVWRRHDLESKVALARFLETWVTVTNRAAEAMSGSWNDELKALCRASHLELKGK